MHEKCQNQNHLFNGKMYSCFLLVSYYSVYQSILMFLVGLWHFRGGSFTMAPS